MNSHRIPIFFTFNDKYTVPAAVAFYSLLHKAKPCVSYEMYVLHSDISEANRRLLQGIVSRFPQASLKFIHTEGFLTKEWKNGNFEQHNSGKQFTVDTIILCFAARFFPQYDKIICSDVDVVFADDISELWETDLTEKYVAGVKNAFMKNDPFELSHLQSEHYDMLKDSYIGTGILVMNLALIRRDNLEKRMMDIIQDDAIIKRWPDQDIINIACENKVAYLPLNYIAYPYMLTRLQHDRNFSSHYTHEELWDSFLNPKIIHYAGVKPWLYPVRYADVWWDIYYYLSLPAVSYSEAYDPLARIKKRVRKYRVYLWALIIIAALLAGLCILLISMTL